MILIVFVFVFLIITNMCPTNQKQRGFDALDREIEQQGYLDEGLDNCDYVRTNN